MKVTLQKEFDFDAAHFLANFPDDHKCRRLHGHSFRFIVSIYGEVDPHTGVVLDYGEITKKVDPLRKSLDHQLLNAIPGLENPTSENIAVYLYNQLKAALPLLKSITVIETPTSRCVYEPTEV